MTNAETVRTIVGIIGNVISFGLFISPLPMFFKIFKAKSVQAFKPDPYVVTSLNCAMWLFYGMPFVHPDSLLVATTNGIGLFIELIYVILFFIYSDWPKRRKILIILFVEVVIMAVVMVITLVFLHGTKSRSMLVGIICIIMNIGMYVSPLTIMKRVIKTKSVRFMPFFLTLATFANGIVWFIYALIKFDPFVLIPNGLGTLSGVVQLVLYATYYRTTKWGDDGGQTEVELQNPTPNGSAAHA